MINDLPQKKSISKYWFNHWIGAWVICHKILWNMGFAKIPQISATAVPAEICWLFSFSRESGEKSEKCTRCGSRPEFLTGVHRGEWEWWSGRQPTWQTMDEKQNSWIADVHVGSYDDPVADTADIQIHVSWGTWLGKQWMNSWITDSDAKELGKHPIAPDIHSHGIWGTWIGSGWIAEFWCWC